METRLALDGDMSDEFIQEIKSAIENPDYILRSCSHHKFYIKNNVLVYAKKSPNDENKYDVVCAGYIEEIHRKVALQ